MYTEDDDEVKVNDVNNDLENDNFYNAFNEDEKSTKKKSKKKKKKEDLVTVTEENDYADFYGTEEDNTSGNSSNKKPLLIIVFIAVIIIVLAILALVFLNKKSTPKVNGDIELNNSSISLKIGEKNYISYTIIGTESIVTSRFTSSNPAVVSVSENGEVTGISGGEATIKVYYTIDGVEREKECNIKVTQEEVKHELSLELSGNTNWTNKDVKIKVDAKSDIGIASLKYAINCNGNCDYKDVTNNEIIISNSGTTKVTVSVKDNVNQEVVKEITTKIDKEAPTVALDQDRNITSNTDVNVCATCSDSLSGCKQGKVCKKFTSSKSNQVITVYDNAGNSKNSSSFNVTIKKTNPPCTLKVSSDGVVSATLSESSVYYGFNSSCTGSNERSKAISINASKKGESGAKVVYYYVKNKNGNVGRCYLTVIKECNCTDSKSTDANCPVTCKYRAN